ncbi:MAG TPA: membrane receptor RagA, partial [Algoriphagus sp.]|nr:membrane receptor RagA [Algoriphagus sp.]
GIQGGRYIYQFNGGEPINEQVNALYSILFRQNYMKLYEQRFGRVYWAHRVDYGFTYRMNFTLASRRELFNNSAYSFYKKPERSYTSNRPDNIEADQAAFPSAF